MNFPRFFFVVFLLSLLLVPPVSAQDKSIDLGAVSFNGCTLEGSTIHADFHADRSTSVTLYDVGVFQTEGSFEVPSKDVSLDRGNSTISMPVTVNGASAGLFIRSPSSSTGCVIDKQYTLFNYAANWNDVRLTFLALLLAAPLTFGTVAVRYKQHFDERKRLL